MSDATAIRDTGVPRACVAAPVPGPQCRVTEAGDTRDAQWDGYVLAHPEGTVFHTTAWRSAVREAFRHEAVYLTALRGDRIVGVLPMFLVASRLAGRMLVSVPYAVGGGIIADDEDAVGMLFNAAKDLAEERRCTTIELRSERAAIRSLPAADRYVGFRRDLPTGVSDVLRSLPRKARAAARNARDKFQLTVSFGDEHLHNVWQLYSINMRRLGSLTYPFRFFERLIGYTPGRHWVSLVKWDSRPVAGLVTFLFKDRVIPYFFGATDDARRCSAANYIYLTAMERGVEEGFRVFDFGRSRRDNPGSYNFKRFQGFEPHSLGYQCYTAPGHGPPNLSPSNPKYRFARKLWTHLPLWVTQAAGARIARHIPG